MPQMLRLRVPLRSRPMPASPFLSETWIEAARRIRSEHATAAPEVPGDIRMNLVVTDVPFGEPRLDAHVDTTSGRLEMELGHLDDPDATVTLDYETAKLIFIEGTPTVLMQSFMAGKMRVQGDMAKLVAAMTQLAPPDPAVASPLQQAIRDITE